MKRVDHKASVFVVVDVEEKSVSRMSYNKKAFVRRQFSIITCLGAKQHQLLLSVFELGEMMCTA